MAREITQFSSIDYNNASDEDIEKNQAPKFAAMRLFEAEAEKGEVDKLGGVENIRRVRLMTDDQKMAPGSNNMPLEYLVYDTKRPAKEVLQEKRAEDLAKLFFSVAPTLANAILLRAAQLFEDRAAGRAIDLTEDKELATRCVEETQAAFKLAQEEAAKRAAQPKKDPKKPFQKRQNGPRNGAKHQTRGKSRPVIQRVQKPTQAR